MIITYIKETYMDSNLLKIFTSVVEKKSITLGAKKLKVTQSNVTLRIKQLEKTLGFLVFHRTSKGIVLTTQGEELLPFAKDIVQKMEEIEVRMKNIKVQNSLRLSSTYSNASIRLISFLKQINTDFPSMQVDIITNNTLPIIQLLLDYKIDIAFINHEPKNKDLLVLNTFDNELLLLESKQKSTNKTILAYGPSCAFYKAMKDYYTHLDITEYKTIEIEDFEIILSCIELGMGRSLIPKSIVKKFGYLSKLKLTPLSKNIVDVPTCLVCRKDNLPKISEYLKKLQL